MDIYGWLLFFLCTYLGIFGLKLIKLSKNKLTGKKNKKYLIFGILLSSAGFFLYLFLMIISFIL
jgi:hypothetical protein